MLRLPPEDAAIYVADHRLLEDEEAREIEAELKRRAEEAARVRHPQR